MSFQAARVVTGLVLLYLVLDLGVPSMPGAFTFEATSSVEVVRLTRDAEEDRPVVLSRPDTFVVLRVELALTEPVRPQRAQELAPVPAIRVSLARAALAPPLSEVG